jgi:hypothetical protein
MPETMGLSTGSYPCRRGTGLIILGGILPLVFVHGVATRDGASYRTQVDGRDALFRRYLLSTAHRLDGAPVVIDNPYWGDLGGRLRWGGASIPGDAAETLGADAVDRDLAELICDTTTDGETDERGTLLSVARDCWPRFVDLFTAAVLTIPSTDGVDSRVGLLATTYDEAVDGEPPEWLAHVGSDEQLISRFLQDLASRDVPDGVEQLGMAESWRHFQEAGYRLRESAHTRATRRLADRIRERLAPKVTDFLGDVFVYLHEQSDAGGRIRERIGGAVSNAARSATSTDPLVVVAHSMGGNIVYDLLTEELQDVTVATLITVGTQIGFFEELQLFRSSGFDDPSGDSQRLPKPTNVARWINVFDPNDLLAFRVAPIFRDTDDYEFNTNSLLGAHGAYFQLPSFHRAVSERLNNPAGNAT